MNGSKHTIGVAIAVPEPFGTELTAWRKGLGDPLALAIPPHVTLITPTELDGDEMVAAIDHLKSVAAEQWRFEIQLRGTGSLEVGSERDERQHHAGEVLLEQEVESHGSKCCL